MGVSEPRPYRFIDEAGVVALSLRAWASVFDSIETALGPHIFARVYPDWRASQAAAVRDALTSNDTWVIDVDEATGGFVNVAYDEADGSGEIHMLAVDPEHQHLGIAARLIDLALDEMRSRGLSLATVATGGDPGHAPARRAYERAGFTPFPQVWYSKLL